MALKDWKKTRDPNHLDVFVKKDKHITIDEMDYYGAPNKYIVEVFFVNPYKKITNRLFKTKKQALRYARAYMKKH